MEILILHLVSLEVLAIIGRRKCHICLVVLTVFPYLNSKVHIFYPVHENLIGKNQMYSNHFEVYGIVYNRNRCP